MVKDKKRGQIAVLVALSMTLLFLLLAMVTNISYLVTAKINLQNAVDLASYAGAAQQARYLTEIGKWNYEMRRNYKAFVYDYVISYNSENQYNPDSNDRYQKYLSGYALPYPAVGVTLSRRPNQNDSNIIQTLYQGNDITPVGSENISIGGFGTLSVSEILQRIADLLGAFNVIPRLQQLGNIFTNLNRTIDTETDYMKNLLSNYQANMHNYNSRLINWAAFDYRNIQARIRGNNFTGLDFNTIENRLLSNSKDSPGMKIFENAPMSVASKVINGYLGKNEATYENNVLELTEDTSSNPMHNASYYTFKKNLLNLNSKSKLFFLKNNYSKISGTNKMGDTGCEGKCNEFTGSYLKLDAYDVSFLANIVFFTKKDGSYKPEDTLYSSIKFTKSPTDATYVKPNFIDNFPVGVAKDARVKTYYPLVAIANTEGIPFNVFFGADEESYNPALIAVSASKPYGSRIGPFISETCTDFKNPESTNCQANGTDPRMAPYLANGITNDDAKWIRDNHLYPDFSTNNDNLDGKNPFGGVKGTVTMKEIKEDLAFGSNYIRIFTMGFKKEARFKEPRDRVKDDGFCNNGTQPGCTMLNDQNQRGVYLENQKIHPQNHRNSIIAWNNNPNIEPPGTDFEAYLSKLVGKAIYAFPNLRENSYKVYTFKYPSLKTDYWSIDDLVKTNQNIHDSMEYSFANTMAVNEFEIYRYIIPNSEGVADNVLKWYDVAKGNVYKKLNDDRSKIINVEVFNDNLIKDEKNSSTNDLSSDDDKMESYTAWRTGLRGYKVKLTNIKDLLSGSGDFANPLYKTYTIKDFNDEEINVDLTKINY